MYISSSQQAESVGTCLRINDFLYVLKQHKLTKKHLNVVNNVEAPICPFKCSKCERGYQSKSGLRKHKLLCTVVVDVIEPVVVPTAPEVVNIDLHAKIARPRGKGRKFDFAK